MTQNTTPVPTPVPALAFLSSSAPTIGGRRWAIHGTECLWWATNPSDCGHNGALPCCPFCGGSLTQVPLDDFISAAEQNPAAYGPGGLDTLVAAHHQNAQTCRVRWTRYEVRIK